MVGSRAHRPGHRRGGRGGVVVALAARRAARSAVDAVACVRLPVRRVRRAGGRRRRLHGAAARRPAVALRRAGRAGCCRPLRLPAGDGRRARRRRRFVGLPPCDVARAAHHRHRRAHGERALLPLPGCGGRTGYAGRRARGAVRGDHRRGGGGRGRDAAFGGLVAQPAGAGRHAAGGRHAAVGALLVRRTAARCRWRGGRAVRAGAA